MNMHSLFRARSLRTLVPACRLAMVASVALLLGQQAIAVPLPQLDPHPGFGLPSSGIGLTPSFAGPCAPTNSIDISTGYDHSSGLLLPATTAAALIADPGWRVVYDPINYNFDKDYTHEPRPAFVISPKLGWTAAPAGSKWIGPHDTWQEEVNGVWIFATSIGVDPVGNGAFITGSFVGHSKVELFLNKSVASILANSAGAPLKTFVGGGTASFVTFTAPLTSSGLRSGKNTIYAKVTSAGAAVGFALQAKVTSGTVNKLTPPVCCHGGTVYGRKYNDDNADGVLGSATLAKIPFTLSGTPSTGGTYSAVTLSDYRGNWSFLGVPPGTYTVAELPLWQCFLTFPTIAPYNYPGVVVAGGRASGSFKFGNYCYDPEVMLWDGLTDYPPLLDCESWASQTASGTHPTVTLGLQNKMPCTITKIVVYVTSPSGATVAPATMNVAIPPNAWVTIPKLTFSGSNVKAGQPICVHFAMFGSCFGGVEAPLTAFEECFWAPCSYSYASSGGGCPECDVLALMGADSDLGASIGELLANWGKAGIGDLDGSGVVDALDLEMLLGEEWTELDGATLLEAGEEGEDSEGGEGLSEKDVSAVDIAR